MPGYSARPTGMCWTREGGGGHDLSGFWGPCPNNTASRPAAQPAHAAHARATPQEQETYQGWNNNGALPGYAARPVGMCWTREGGGGQDLSGFWGPCSNR